MKNKTKKKEKKTSKNKQDVAPPGGGQKNDSSKEIPRIKTGVPRLDYILRGGFIKGATYTVMGPPGSGKTIFGNQLCFNHIHENNGNCIYLTLLAESHSKMLTHIGILDFYDESVIPDHLTYMSGYRTLKNEGLRGLLKLIQKTIKERKANLLVMDGVKAIEKAQDNELDLDEFIHELQATASIMGCTSIMLTSNSQMRTDEVESVLVDGVIEMSYQLVGPRAVRELTVHKFRGTNFMVGKHETEISNKGLMIHPRTEIQFDEPLEHATEERLRMAFGVRELDQMLEGGLMSGTMTVLLGSPGTGKTMLGLSYLVEGAKKGQRGIYFGFYEPPPRLIEKAERIGIGLKKYVDNGMIELMWQPPLEHYIDSLAEQLLEKIKKENHPKSRLFIDGLEGFRTAAIYPERVPRFLSAFANQLRMSDVTTIISEELDIYRSEVVMPTPALGTVSEGVILLRYLELNSQIHRLISILKMRESKYDTSIREFKILDEGIKVSDSFESAENVLSGQSRLIAGKGQKPKSSMSPSIRRGKK